MSMPDDVWKYIATAFGSIVLTGGVGYATHISDFATREDVSRQISVESPYLPDRKLIADQLTRISQDVRNVDAKVDRLLEARQK